MPDLSDELRRVAADAASRATPAALADVIRRGNRRRRRVIGQRVAGGLSVLGLSAAVLVTGAVHGPAGPASPSAGARVTALTETTSSVAGKMTIQVRYRPAARHGIGSRLLSITYSGSSDASARHPVLVFMLTEPLNGACSVKVHGHGQPKGNGCRPPIVRTITLKLSRSELGHFTGSVPVRPLDHGKPVPSGTLTASLGDQDQHQVSVLMQEGLILGPAGSAPYKAAAAAGLGHATGTA
jgi:hypothetical protein